MDNYFCSVCGYYYNPEEGEPSSGVAIGTRFDDLPEDFKCPLCGADKSQFEKEK